MLKPPLAKSTDVCWEKGLLGYEGIVVPLEWRWMNFQGAEWVAFPYSLGLYVHTETANTRILLRTMFTSQTNTEFEDYLISLLLARSSFSMTYTLLKKIWRSMVGDYIMSFVCRCRSDTGPHLFCILLQSRHNSGANYLFITIEKCLDNVQTNKIIFLSNSTFLSSKADLNSHKTMCRKAQHSFSTKGSRIDFIHGSVVN